MVKFALDEAEHTALRVDMIPIWDDATDDAGRCLKCGGEVKRDYDPAILDHYGEQDEVINDEGVEFTVRRYKCQSCGNESCDID